MKKRIMVIILAATLGAAVIAGCGDNTASDTGKSVEKQTDNGQSGKTSEEMSENGSVMDMLSEANMVATVIDFSESGCTVIKGTESEDEQKLASAWGDVDDKSKINVVYSNSVSFQLATATVGASEANLEDTGKSELKKQSNVYLYGTYQDDGTFLADKVIIYRTLR